MFHKQDSFPHLIIAPNAGIAAYTSWLPTIVRLSARASLSSTMGCVCVCAHIHLFYIFYFIDKKAVMRGAIILALKLSLKFTHVTLFLFKLAQLNHSF